MSKILLFIIIFIISSLFSNAQDTFSIVALDSITGEVGSAGASCVDMNNFPGYNTDFLGELFPGLGAINTQAWYLEQNQANARDRMNLGDTPAQIIEWLNSHDAQNQPQKRQYGIVAMVNDSPESAAFTGTATDNYKNHITGPNYSIQGNILLGQVVLDSMEARFLNAEGSLACKLMAALQGAKMVGADSRCFSNGTSSLFAFVKVAQPDDIFGNPSFLLSVKTPDNAGIEPIDSLQVLVDAWGGCNGVGIKENNWQIKVFPNPAKEKITFQLHEQTGAKILKIYNSLGKETFTVNNITNNSISIDVSHFSPGFYTFQIFLENKIAGNGNFIIQ